MMTLQEMLNLTACLLLSEIPAKTIQGLFNTLKKILILNTNNSKYMCVKLLQLKTVTENRIV
jgi:hypothetical protein